MAAALIWLPRVADSGHLDQRALHLRDHLVVDVAHGHAVAAGGEELADVPLDGLGQGLGRAGQSGAVGVHGGVGELGVDDVAVDDLLRIEGGHAAHEILELADVAGPAVLAEALEGGLVQALAGKAAVAGLVEEVAGEDGDVLEALAQRREADGDDVEAVEQVFPELPGADRLAQVRGAWRRRCGRWPGSGCRPPTVVNSPSWSTRRRPGLGLGGHVADLVEEERAAGGLLEPALGAVHGAGEGAPLVAEQLALDQFAGEWQPC